jgi:acyl dehydratase
VPKRKPDFVYKQATSPDQALTYRLSGDYNPLHIGTFFVSSLEPCLPFAVDPSIGRGAGFGGVILHGLCTFGFSARAIVKTVGGGDPNSLKLYGVRFTSPVKPGDTLETQAWEVGPGPNGTVEITFITKDLTSGKVCIVVTLSSTHLDIYTSGCSGRDRICQENKKQTMNAFPLFKSLYCNHKGSGLRIIQSHISIFLLSQQYPCSIP